MQDLLVYEETAGALSEIGAKVYFEARNYGILTIRDAWSKAIIESKAAHAKQIKEWGSLDQYIRAHGEFGQELKQIGERSLISFTEDLEVAKYFAGPDGIVIQLKLPKSKFIQQTLKDSSELERLIINGEKP